MSEEIREHKHCKNCGTVISGIGTFNCGNKYEAYRISICEDCIIKEGFKVIKKKGEKLNGK